MRPNLLSFLQVLFATFAAKLLTSPEVTPKAAGDALSRPMDHRENGPLRRIRPSDRLLGWVGSGQTMEVPCS
jgi:hypothetical protein